MTSSHATVSAHAAGGRLSSLAHAMIRQARILDASGQRADARALARRARALDRLAWSYRAA